MRIIDLLKAGLEEFPQLPIDHVFPSLIEQLQSIPAPQDWVNLQKNIIKSGLSQEDYIEDLTNKVYGE